MRAGQPTFQITLHRIVYQRRYASRLEIGVMGEIISGIESLGKTTPFFGMEIDAAQQAQVSKL